MTNYEQAVQEDGETFVDDVSAGDVWFFPACAFTRLLYELSRADVSQWNTAQHPSIRHRRRVYVGIR